MIVMSLMSTECLLLVTPFFYKTVDICMYHWYQCYHSIHTASPRGAGSRISDFGSPFKKLRLFLRCIVKLPPFAGYRADEALLLDAGRSSSRSLLFPFSSFPKNYYSKVSSHFSNTRSIVFVHVILINYELFKNIGTTKPQTFQKKLRKRCCFFLCCFFFC